MDALTIKVKYKGKIFDALVDGEDYDETIQYKWYLDKDGYACTGKPHNIKMHQLIIGKREGYVIDHINHKKLDNRKCNLRHITRQSNAMNMKKERGIYWNEQRKKWIVQIRINAKTKHIGCYTTYEEAKQARKIAEEMYFKPIIEEC